MSYPRVKNVLTNTRLYEELAMNEVNLADESRVRFLEYLESSK